MRASVLVIVTLMGCATVLYGQLSDFVATDFEKADSIAELYPQYPLKDLKVLSDKLTGPLVSDVEKFRSIFKWVCLNIENDYTLYLENKNRREKLTGNELATWEKKFSRHVFDILVKGHRTICTGYAYLIKELAFHAGLNCKIIDGYGRSAQANIGGSGIVNHSWNVVQLAGKWYPCDGTWSSGAIDGPRQTFVKKFDDAYFLSDPALFTRSHYPLDTIWMLLDHKPTLESFLNGPIVYIGTFRYGVEPLSPYSFRIEASRGANISFQFVTDQKDKFQQVEFYIEASKTYDPFVIMSSNDNKTVYSIDHTFSSRGKRAVHIVLDGSHVLTYEVNVR
ncbi:MAG TPA: hypothetical protein VK589_08380 [Chryseolinea sp.]|nr:hypothetical protein [Chryseolinea sp.]